MDEVLLDVSRLVGRRLKGMDWSAVDRVALAYVKHYGPQARAVVVVAGVAVICHAGPSQVLFDWLLEVGSERSARRSLASSVLMGARRVSRPGEWFICPTLGGLQYRRYVRAVQRLQVRSLYVLHDMIPVTHPQYCSDGAARRHEVRLTNALQNANALVCNSRATLGELQNFARDRMLRIPPVVTSLLAPEIPLQRSGSRPMEGPYFVVLSDVSARRNQQMLLQIWQRLVEHFGDDTPSLLLLGRRGVESASIMKLVDRSPILRPFVKEYPSATQDEMVPLLRHAQALLCPSFADSYGRPVIEALSHRVPVIAADLPVLREVGGDVPEYLDPLDTLSWIDRILAYLDPDCPERQQQLHKMKDFSPPTWADHFAQVDAMRDSVPWTPEHDDGG